MQVKYEAFPWQGYHRHTSPDLILLVVPVRTGTLDPIWAVPRRSTPSLLASFYATDFERFA